MYTKSRVESIIGIKESDLVNLDSDSRSEFINGYTFINNTTYKPTPIGLHSDAAIIFGREKSDLSILLDQPYPLVDQVFSASLNFNDYGKRTNKNNLIKICRTLLRSAYESIYLAAIQRKRKILYLTLIGGGVFSNPIQIILEEIVRSHKLYTNHPKSCLKKVVLCVYGDNPKIVKTIKELNK
jgi:hypothetical protein